VHFEDFHFVSTLKGIDGGAQPGYSAANDDDLSPVSAHAISPE
jgi:hypothetical protein